MCCLATVIVMAELLPNFLPDQVVKRAPSAPLSGLVITLGLRFGGVPANLGSRYMLYSTPCLTIICGPKGREQRLSGKLWQGKWDKVIFVG